MTEHDLAPGKYLNTLAFRCSPELVGSAVVHVRHLDEVTWKLWDDFSQQCRKKFNNDDAQAPYSIATTVLSMISGGYVHFDPDRRAPFLASLNPIESTLLRRVFTLTHHLALGQDVGTIDLTTPPELAKRIAGTTEQKYLLAEHLQPARASQLTAPTWLYRTVAWELSQRLACRPWSISENRTITLRPDSTGGLVAFEDPWQNEQGGRYALSRTALRLKTVPNITNPVLLLSSRVTRISSSLVFSRTALAEQPGRGRPLLEVSLNGRGGARTINRLALQALGRLEMDYSILRAIDERSKREQRLLGEAREKKEAVRFPREHPGQVWPILPKNYSFPIGTGTGMHHLRLLHSHFTCVFADTAAPLEVREVRVSMPRRPTDPENISKQEYQRRKEERDRHPEPKTLGPIRARGSLFPSPESIVASVETAGFTKLRIACLWYRDETRLRMLDTFCKTFDLDPQGLDPHDGTEFSLHGDRVTAVFHHAEDFLKPGPAGNRTAALAGTGASLRSLDGVLVGAWCETEIPTTAESSDGSGASLEDLDAKPQTKKILAERGVPAQYLRGKDDKGVITPKAKDHPAEMALLDLYRSLGIIDDRIANALRPEKAGYQVDRIAHVGIYVRQQNKRKGEFGQPKVIITAAALVPPQEDGETWTMLGWSCVRPEWLPYRIAQPAFHSGAYPEGTGDKKSYRQRWDDAAETVERALADLADELDGVSYAVTVDAQSARRMWDGLQNTHLGGSPESKKCRYWLPGCTLVPQERPRAIIRVNIDDEEVLQPVGATHVAKANGKGGEPKEKETATTLYEVTTDFGTPFWVLCNVPRAFDGDGANRLGSKHTRWDAKPSVSSERKEERRKGEMPQNWYSMTANEIYPLACAEDVSAEALAVAAAKLCHQAQFWDGRARFPVPLHAAKQMDLDHPQYRRTTAPEEKLSAEPGA
ncbi:MULTISPECIES: RNaseH domain-containing protein [unclassified Crossiella]|uniref:RNaseH domain-containing protein n=1 Tax=unclassified Crossiella TaxID=2620835 RepID=UPI001FFFB299|nr:MULTISPECIES: RNaseH domain-containing protein [unclassified Crossiella]MCK2245275.1 RNaseH domain-containing protein [Crossiella sp. S99.2]MCK2258927.1 RNaseH domain-containing protein [Crossiella sp. S99.1]